MASNAVQSAPSRDWSNHSKLSRLFKPDQHANAIQKKIKVLVTFYGQMTHRRSQRRSAQCAAVLSTSASAASVRWTGGADSMLSRAVYSLDLMWLWLL